MIMADNIKYFILLFLPVIGFTLWLHLWKKQGNDVVKTFSAIVCSVVAVIGATQHGGMAWLVAAAIMICAVADYVLEKSFVAGTLVFMLAHILLIVYLVLNGGKLSWNLLIALAIVIGTGVMYRKFIFHRNDKIMPVIGVYSCVLAFMVAVALSMIEVELTTARIIMMVAAVCFTVSDAILGDCVVTGRKSDLKYKILMFFYTAAIFLFPYSVFYLD